MRIDRAYYHRRLCEELEATARAGHLRTAYVHRELARRYRALLDESDALDQAAGVLIRPQFMTPSMSAPALVET